MAFYETDRLILRGFQEKDIDDFHEYKSTLFNVLYQNSTPFTYEQSKATIAWRIGKDNYWSVVLKENSKHIGCLEFEKDEHNTYSIGYELNEKYAHKGYATEASQALVKHLFTKIHARRIICDMSENNIGSWRLAERLGFRREGHFIEDDISFNEKDVHGNPLYLNSFYYGLLKREWSKE